MSQVLRTLRTLAIPVAVALFASVSTVTLAGPGDRVSSAQLSTLKSAVRTESETDKQELAVREIPKLLNEAELEGVDGKTLQDLASLLDSPNGEVRRLVAFALSMFEGRAIFAVPRLTEILRSAECSNLQKPNPAYVDTVSTVRLAIKNINGVDMPQAVCLIKLHDPEGA